MSADAAAPREPAATDLREWIRDRLQGGCKVLSLGDYCPCALCAFGAMTDEISRLRAELERTQEELREARQIPDPYYCANPDCRHHALIHGAGPDREGCTSCACVAYNHPAADSSQSGSDK